MFFFFFFFQLHESQTFAINDLPAPPSRGGILGKKKTPYDNSNPYGKTANKLKKQPSKAQYGATGNIIWMDAGHSLRA